MHPQTLRMYETRGLIAPKRSPKNTRLYSRRDVERLRRIQEMTQQGLNLVGVETVLALEEQVAETERESERAGRKERGLMQPDKFTQKSQEAIAATLELARSHRNPEAAPAHLLVSLLDQTEGLVVPILQRVGADTATIAARANEAVAAAAETRRRGAKSRGCRAAWPRPCASPSAKWGATARA